MDAKITGTTMPVLEVMLQPGESIISEAGQLSWMTAPIAMTTHTQMGGGGGFFGALKRIAGIKNMVFGGDGIFLALLTGPGRVWLQTMPPANMASALLPYLPKPSSASSNTAAGAVIGGIAGSLLGGNR